MDSISNQFFVNNAASANAAKAYAKNGDIGFSQMMAAKSSVDGLSGAARADVSPALTMALGGLIGRYGINVPPKLRILSAGKRFKLEDEDERGDKFDLLLKDNSGVTELLTQTQTKALTARDAAMETAIESFMKGSASGYDMKGFLTEFKENEKPRAISVVYDGIGTYVEEQDAKGWRPIKGESDFMADLIKAYSRFSVTNTATAEHAAKAGKTPG
jgi:hypothetical protein